MMIPLRIAGATRAMAKDQPEYKTLHIRDVPLNNGGNMMVSLWEPTPAQLKVLNEGGGVMLAIMGTAWPPVLLDVQEAPKVEDI